VFEALLRHPFPALVIMGIKDFPFEGRFAVDNGYYEKNAYCPEVGEYIFK